MKQIAIIGGGFSGTATAVHLTGQLIRQQARDVRIVIYEPRGIMGAGIAYAPDLPDSYLLNHELDHMGSVSLDALPANDDKDFFRWAQANKGELAKHYPRLDFTNPKMHPPRSAYGRYLNARLEEAKTQAAAHGIEIEVRSAAVEDIKKGNAGVIIKTKEGEEPFASAVLALGHWYKPPQKEHAATGRAFTAYPPQQYLHNDQIPKGATLLVMGTGLTAVDAAIGALESGRYSHVTMVSRRGQVRGVRGKTESYTPKFLTLENLEKRAAARGDKNFQLADVAELLKQEAAHAYGHEVDWDEIMRPCGMKKFLSEQLKDVDAGKELRWRSLVDAFDPIRQQIFERLSSPEQKLFLNNWQNLYLSYRAAMPIENGRKLVDYMEKGMLDITGGLSWMGYNTEKGKFDVEVLHDAQGHPASPQDILARSPKGTTRRRIEADVMVDARGQSRDYRYQPLLKHLVETGVATANPNGGIEADISSLKVKSAGHKEMPLYVLGPSIGSYFVNPPNTLNLSQASQRLAAELGNTVKAKGRELQPS